MFKLFKEAQLLIFIVSKLSQFVMFTDSKKLWFDKFKDVIPVPDRLYVFNIALVGKVTLVIVELDMSSTLSLSHPLTSSV